MSIYAPDPINKQPFKLMLFGFLFVSAIAVGFLGTGLILGLEPRIFFERSADGSFRVTSTNFFSGYPFHTKTITGVTEVKRTSAALDRRSDSQREKQRQQRQKSLDFHGRDGARIGWDREDDQPAIEAFMRGDGATFSLADTPPLWRMALAWCSAGFGFLTFLAGVRNSFPKRL